jgi:hypothetical protein
VGDHESIIRGLMRGRPPAAATARPVAPARGTWPRSGPTELQELPQRRGAAAQPGLRQTDVRVAPLDRAHGDPPRLAQRDGGSRSNSASVIKFVYLMAAYAWQAKLHRAESSTVART